jgi:preprotein translocase subunit Sss1
MTISQQDENNMTNKQSLAGVVAIGLLTGFIIYTVIFASKKF